MARRSSARLRGRKSSTPKRVSLSHDAPVHTPRTAPVKLSTLCEDGEMPGAFPSSKSPSPAQTPVGMNNKQAKSVVNLHDSTPAKATPLEPSDRDMHPKQYQQSTAKPLDEVRWLGFSNMAPHTEPPKQASRIAILQGTPTRAPKSANVTESPKYQFTFRREQSLELSPEAKTLMDNKREEAARIREQMTATVGATGNGEAGGQRRIALPKGKKGRFSDAHMEQFKKMDSIAGHASTFRAALTIPNASRTEAVTIKPQVELQVMQHSAVTPSKSLKRSPSKAQLDESDHVQQALQRSYSKSRVVKSASQLPHSASSKDLRQQVLVEESRSAKGVKRKEGEDVSIGKPALSQRSQVAFTSPTQASLARVASTKPTSIPTPMTARSPQKPPVGNKKLDSSRPSTPLLARSPAKMSLWANAEVENPQSMMSPLLMRSPFKQSSAKNITECEKALHEKPSEAPLLSRSPMRISVSKKDELPAEDKDSASTIPLLSRSPAKLTQSAADTHAKSDTSLGKPTGIGLVGRFNLLRASPVKSILRSPQRLYSTDPAKVAAGTHLASPAGATANKDKPLPTVDGLAGPTVHPEKHVDFTSSTKARYERAQSEADSTPSKGPTPPPKDLAGPTTSPGPTFAEYPALPSETSEAITSPQRHRQTAAPCDFTFTSHGNGIVFGQSPSAPVSSANSKRPSTIRHVSIEPQLQVSPIVPSGSKKRKFDSENDKAVDAELDSRMSDKENVNEEEEQRPNKRSKPNAPETVTTKPATKLPTLGVKPKKTKDAKDAKPKSITMARLNALAQPKRRS